MACSGGMLGLNYPLVGSIATLPNVSRSPRRSAESDLGTVGFGEPIASREMAALVWGR